MIFKSELVDAINSLNHDLVNLHIKVEDLERKINMFGFLVQDEPVEIKKSKKASKQPRTKDGKFAKKK